ncbi:MAG: hypothetical protein OEZ35_07105 [Candidatus Bathyarchaeota archaeon]|nr:hypothetical protein [Candidatus Bathyarchaeota archaeon]
MLTNQFVKQPLLKFLDELDIQYEKISAEITSIYSEGSDYILSSREKIFVTVKNTGIYEREFIVSVNPSFWEITDYWGWFEWERVDWDNIKKETLKPFETKTIWFAAMPDGIHIDEDLTFNVWFEEGWLWWATQYRLDSHSATFHSIDLDVEAYITASSDPNIAMGETVDITVTVQNMKANPISFFLDAKLRDQSGDFERYDEQISISPSDQVHLEPNQKTTFTITWSVPSDALIGYYQLAVDCEKSPSSHIYLDNLLWKQIFFVYDLNILTPTSLHPANAGDPEDPNSIAVYATGIPLEGTPKFLISIDSGWIEPEITDRLLVPAGYALKVTPPTKADVGKYDLDTVALFAERGGAYTEHDTDSEPNAVEYTSAPSVEPIERGLAWLRTRQYGDGSWRSNVGVAALSVLAFLNAGLDETDSDVDEAIQYLLSKARGDGSIYSSYPTYETSLALMALVATHNSDHQATIDAARDWLANSQWDENCIWGSVGKDSWYYGGFGYGWHTRPDLSNSQFALLALDAAGLPKDDPLWTKAQVFLHRCQNIEFPITLNIEGSEYTVQPFNHFGGYDGGFIYYPGASLAGGQKSYGSMTGAGIWGLLLSGVAKSDQRLAEAMNWVADNYSWDTNPGIGWWRPYYYYLSMSKALTMYGQKIIDGHDWYQELCDKLEGSQTNIGPELGYWSTSAEDYNPDLTTAYAILSLQTRAAAPPIQRLSYLTFVLRSNSLIRILDPEGNLVGYNYMTGMGENNIPTAVYSGPFYEPQYVVIVNPEAGTYDLELIGISEGQYELTIQGNYGEEVTDVFEYTGEIAPAELHGTDVTVTAIVGPVDVYTEPPEFEEIIDNTPPSITVLTPREDPPEALQDGVTLEANVTDPSGVDWVTFSIRETDGSVIDAMFESMSANYIGDDVWQIPSFNTYVPELPDGYYLLLVNASDTLGNEGDKTVLFSIRNWACLELLPSTQANKAGRTMPVKFSLRVFENVDPAKPFVYNEELTIVIYEEGDPDNILQTSTYGETARDYRIDSIGELYITNFKTIRKKLTTYVVEICRKDLLIGWFTFKTVK